MVEGRETIRACSRELFPQQGELRAHQADVGRAVTDDLTVPDRVLGVMELDVRGPPVANKGVEL